MKTELTIEQSQRLIELGVDANKASDIPLQGSAFTTTDLLGILPMWIKYKNMLLWLKIWIDPYSEEWCAAYEDGTYDLDEADTFQSSEELVDALYSLLVLLIENKLIIITK